jgi:hypothetical protein
MEDAVLRTIARLDGTPFPSTARLASRWLGGRVPVLRTAAGDRADGDRAGGDRAGGDRAGGDRDLAGAAPETAYCAQVLAATYQAMGLLPDGRRPGWYDPGSFWSGDSLGLTAGFRLGGEIRVAIPPGQ